MPEKKWKDLSQREKIEDLHREVLRLRDAFDRLADGAVSRTLTMATVLESELNKVAERVEALENRLPPPGGNSG
jgi:hypothetical protein